MEHLYHLQKNKELLDFRFAILKIIREFFWQEDFVEVDTPNLVALPGQEPNLSPVRTVIHNESDDYIGYLHTSPEYAMKKMLAAGWEKIFYLGKCWRDYESFGGMHNPEFTMLEFYRVGADMFRIMEDVERLFDYILQQLWNNFKFEILNFKTIFNDSIFKFEKITMKDIWKKYVDVNLDEYLSEDKMFVLCVGAGLKPARTENYEELFYRIFLNKIEPNLRGPMIIYNYPAKMAALARLSLGDSRYAERFEVYFDNIELANAFSELTDAKEQKRRLLLEQEQRKQAGKEVYNIDEEFIEALEFMPASAGIALGVDRLVMALASLRHGSLQKPEGSLESRTAGQGCKNIEDVITLPASKIFKT